MASIKCTQHQAIYCKERGTVDKNYLLLIKTFSTVRYNNCLIGFSTFSLKVALLHITIDDRLPSIELPIQQEAGCMTAGVLLLKT